MIGKARDTIAENPPEEFRAVLNLMVIACEKEQYSELVNHHLSSLPRFAERKSLLETGFFSGLDFLQLIIACGAKRGSNTTVASVLLERLIEWMFVTDAGIISSEVYARYHWNQPKILLFRTLGILDNILLGPSYVVQKYRFSVPPIFAKKGENEFTGTGFLTVNSIDPSKRVIVTAKHNVDPSEGVTATNIGPAVDLKFRPLAEKWVLHPSLDMAAMPVACSQANAATPLYALGAARVLSRTISMGYPRVAPTKWAHLLAHGGELNASVTDYYEDEFLIISNAVAPGSSGGPVLDEAGLCLGMIIREFEIKHESGTTKSNAAIPAKKIFSFVNSLP